MTTKTLKSVLSFQTKIDIIYLRFSGDSKMYVFYSWSQILQAVTSPITQQILTNIYRCSISIMVSLPSSINHTFTSCLESKPSNWLSNSSIVLWISFSPPEWLSYLKKKKRHQHSLVTLIKHRMLTQLKVALRAQKITRPAALHTFWRMQHENHLNFCGAKWIPYKLDC